ncbi:hypothetical protein TNCV_2448161 [Trichonephila clavipes]|uniref:Uncharacterized protein n=1 Tax=Trichonephila clavipes TaxID=2585209 RepID=A0A8X6SJK2_TRICX|nr:hypothetical protein TNCV_2448161 [Trichonephila clavipes]
MGFDLALPIRWHLQHQQQTALEQPPRSPKFHPFPRNSNLGPHTGQTNAVRGINAGQIRCSQLASLDKNNAFQEIKLRLSYLQGKNTTMSVIAHPTEKEWISANERKADKECHKHRLRAQQSNMQPDLRKLICEHIIRVLHQKDVNQKQHICF